MYRTHDCNSLRKIDIGKQVTLAGWVHVSRDHGGVIFIDLRDREGMTQVVFRPEENAEVAKQAHSLRSEDVIEVSGRVAARVPGTENPKLATGDIEVIPNRLRILNRADALPFPHDLPIAVIGWGETIGDALTTRPDLDVLAVRLPGARRVAAQVRRAARPVRLVSDIEANALGVTHVLVEAAALGANSAMVPSGTESVVSAHTEMSTTSAYEADLIVTAPGQVELITLRGTG